MIRIVVMIVAVSAGACSRSESSVATLVDPKAETSVATLIDPSAETSAVAELDTGDVVGFDVTGIDLDGDSWRVALADTPDLRRRGLMEVEDLGDLDGMIFDMEEERAGAFVMRNTLIPLDIAFFDRGGALLAVLTMEPCTEDPCPTYSPGVAFRYALEAPAGALGHLPSSARFSFMD